MAIAPGQLAAAMGLAVILVAVIIACANLIHWFGREHAIKREQSQTIKPEDLIVPPKDFILLRVLLDKDEHASLSTFQFLMWTLLISFLYITLWFLQFLNGRPDAPPAIPESLMALMGISIAVPLVNKGIMDYKQFKSRPEGEVYHEPCYASMLEEDGQPSLLRLQMFLWTLASIVIYFWAFLTAALSAGMTFSALGLPVIDPTLLFLMGLSQTGYLGSKAYAGTVKKEDTGQITSAAPPGTADQGTARRSLVIREIIPRTARPKETVTLLGSGFGTNKDTLMLGNDKIPEEHIGRWDDTRIEFTLKETIPPGKYPVRVIGEGSSAEVQISVSGPQWAHGLNEIPADIVSDIWIDDPTQKGYRFPPIGYFIPKKRYYFFFEFAVPPGTPSWGRTQFKAQFYIDGEKKDERSFLPGYMNGNNYGVFDHIFTTEKEYSIEIRGMTPRTMKVVVKNPPGA